MGRPLSLESSAHARQLLGYIGYGGYNNNRNYACYNRSGCLAGAIIGAVVFGLIAIGLLMFLLLRIRRQRAAAAASQQYPPASANYQPNPAGPYPDQYSNQQYPGQAPYGNQQPQQPYYPGYSGSGPPPQAPPANMSGAEREAWEAEQYAKYGEAGLVQGYPAGASSGVQMSQLPNKQ